MADNGHVKRQRTPQEPAVTVHCAVCFNQGRMTPMTTVIKGYAVCAEHTALVSAPNFDIFELFGRNPL